MCGDCGCSHENHGITALKAEQVYDKDHTHEHSRRRLQVEQDVLAKNNELAATNRDYFARQGILALNLVSSPGSGKTTILEQTILNMKSLVPISVVEGDQQTLLDAERIGATGVPVVQVNTGTGCHLDGRMIFDALTKLDPAKNSVLFIENVGNLVCPAMFDLGEAAKVVIISVTEGEDKPLKYPHMFHVADFCIINKIDLLPHVPFSTARCREYAQQVNPDLDFVEMSALSGEGMQVWQEWLLAQMGRKSSKAARG